MSSNLKAFKERAEMMLGENFEEDLAGPAGFYWMYEITDGHEDELKAAEEYVSGLHAKQPLPAPNEPAAG